MLSYFPFAFSPPAPQQHSALSKQLGHRKDRCQLRKASCGFVSFSLRLPSGQSLGQPNLEFGTPLVQRAIEEIIHHIQPAFFVPLQFIDIAIFEDAGGERKLLCGVVNKQRAFHELATIIPGENASASEIEMCSLKTLAVYDALVRRIIRTHFFTFGRSTRASLNSSGPLVRRHRRRSG